MKLKKIFAGITAFTMLLAAVPTVSFAEEANKYPVITVSNFADMRSDVRGVQYGTDIALESGSDYYDAEGVGLPQPDWTQDAVATNEAWDGEAFRYADEELQFFRRNKVLVFSATSNAEDPSLRSFAEEGTTVPKTGSIKMAYMDCSKQPLVWDKGADNPLELRAATWDDDVWIDLTTDVESFESNLQSFFDANIDHRVMTVNKLLATGTDLQVVVYNIIADEFLGYLRIMVTDNAGMSTVKDFPIVVDGHYPQIAIETSTDKMRQGEMDTAEVAVNTYISEYDFASEESNGDVNSTQQSLRYKVVDETALAQALNAMKNGESYEYTMANGVTALYAPTDIWAMNDVYVDTVKISDDIISSGIKNVRYTVSNNPDDVVEGNVIEEGTLDVISNDYFIAETGKKIVIEKEGFNVLTITAEDNSGLVKTDKYYFFIDKTAPKADYELVDLAEKVVSLFSTADKVTNKQQGIDLASSEDEKVATTLISNIDTANRDVYRYRFLSRKEGALADDENGVPEGYALDALSDTGLDYGSWLRWDLSTETPILSEEFDGLVQVRVQDRAGNWSVIFDDDQNTVIADGTKAVTESCVYGENSSEVTVKNAKTAWMDETLYYKVVITDSDLANGIRSSGLKKTGQASIKVKAWVENGSQADSVKLLGSSADNRASADPSNDKILSGLKFSAEQASEITLTPENLFYDTDEDKSVWFIAEYEGTGIAYISYEITDNAGNTVEYPVVSADGAEQETYNVALRVDKITPYVTFKGMTAAETEGYTPEDTRTDLLSVNGGKEVQYEKRDMPWGPYNQILEVTVKDDDITDVQSSAGLIKVKTDKALELVCADGTSKKIGVGESSIAIDDCTFTDTSFAENKGRTFFLIYKGTGKAHVSIFVQDSVDNPDENTRAYPEEDSYDAMLRVDKTAPEVIDFKLVEVENSDVEDNEVDLFSIDIDAIGNNQKYTTRQQMKITFGVNDNVGTEEQSGVVRSEEGKMVSDDYAANNYVSRITKAARPDYLYKDAALTYAADDVPDSGDPVIDYILLPVKVGEIDGKGGMFDPKKTVEDYINEDTTGTVKWIGTWKDGSVVIPREFQGAIVFRTTDRVGNVAYSSVETFVAESNAPQIDFAPQTGGIYSQNNYGWSKREAEYVEIRVKDNNFDGTKKNPDAWLDNVFVKIIDKDGNDITATDAAAYAENLGSKSVAEPDKLSYKGFAEGRSLNGEFGYDILPHGVTVEKTDGARDKDGYIHLGYVKVKEDAQIRVTVFDKAKRNGADYTGNKTVGVYTARFDRTAPVIESFELISVADNEYALKLSASDALSGMAPGTADATYNTYTSQKSEGALEGYAGFFADSCLWIESNDDAMSETLDSGLINEGQYELPGLQYALVPGNGSIEGIEAWNFGSDPNSENSRYKENGYFGEKGKEYVWHNYIDETVPVIKYDFDGYIVVRAVDKAGNITLMGSAPIVDVTADRNWANETQFVQVKSSGKYNGAVSVQYGGNNGLVYPADAMREISATSLSEGGLVEVANEGVTNVVVRAVESGYSGPKSFEKSVQEGKMVIGNLTADGSYIDYKYQLTSVKIDKTTPDFDFKLVAGGKDINKENGLAEGYASKCKDLQYEWLPKGTEKIEDTIPNGLSKIASGIKSIEFCFVPEGSEAEVWHSIDDFEAVKNGEDVNNGLHNFTGTFKIRVTDNAGNVAVKTSKLRMEEIKPIINISKSYKTKCSHEPVEVLVKVTPGHEASEIKEVSYTVDDGNKLELTPEGGVISVEKEGETVIKVFAETRSGETADPVETTVVIHYEDIAMPTLENINSGEWAAEDKLTVKDNTKLTDVKLYYSMNSGVWTQIGIDELETVGNDYVITGLKPGRNTVRLQAKRDCSCKSDVNEYEIWYEDANALPNISVSYDNSWKKDFSVVTVYADKGDLKADITSVTVDVTGEGKEETKGLSVNGGALVFSEEGEWTIYNITVATQAGKEYVLMPKNDEINAKPGNMVLKTDSIDDSWSTQINIDRTAPMIAEFKVADSAEFAILDADNNDWTQKGKNLIYQLTYDGAPIEKVEWAATEKGAQTVWNDITGNGTDSATKTVKNIITKAFDGTVALRVTDTAGNVAQKSVNVRTEGIKPEISLTAPVGWQTGDVYVTVDVLDKGVSSQVESVAYELRDKRGNVKMKGTSADKNNNPAKMNSNGGVIVIGEEGEFTLYVTAVDYAGNEGEQEVEIKIDKTAPTYSGSVVLSEFNIHEISEDDWDYIHDGWTYNHDVSLNGITDDLSGVAKVEVTFVGKDGTITKNDVNTDYSFSSSGEYNVAITDNAGNVRNIGFTINKSLAHTINVVEVDSVGKLNIAVTDGPQRLTFYQKDEDDRNFVKMYNGITDKLWDGRTGVRQIYATDGDGNKTNTLYVLVAPSSSYDLSVENIGSTPNRYVSLCADEVAEVEKITGLNGKGEGSVAAQNSGFELNEDGIYVIKTK